MMSFISSNQEIAIGVGALIVLWLLIKIFKRKSKKMCCSCHESAEKEIDLHYQILEAIRENNKRIGVLVDDVSAIKDAIKKCKSDK